MFAARGNSKFLDLLQSSALGRIGHWSSEKDVCGDGRRNLSHDTIFHSTKRVVELYAKVINPENRGTCVEMNHMSTVLGHFGTSGEGRLPF